MLQDSALRDILKLPGPKKITKDEIIKKASELI